MRAINQIRRIISGADAATVGTVIRVTDGGVSVAVARGGVKSLRRAPGDVTAYRTGDTVRISGDAVTGRRPGKGPVYPV